MGLLHLTPNIGLLLRPVATHADIPAPAIAGDIVLYTLAGDPTTVYAKAHDDSHAAIGGGGGGSGDFMADGSVPMTGDLQLGGNAILDAASLELDYAGGNHGRLTFNSDGFPVFDSDDLTAAFVVYPAASPVVTALADDAQALATGTFVNVTLGVATGGFAPNFSQTDPTKLVADLVSAGDWVIEAFAAVDCRASGAIGTICEVELRVNGTRIARSSKAFDGSTSPELRTMPVRVTLASSDEITLAVKQSSGGTVDLHSSLSDAWSGLVLTRAS